VNDSSAATESSISRGLELANALVTQGRASEAIPYYERALAAEPVRLEWICALASLLGRVERHEEAIAHADRALRLDPECFAALFTQAGSLLTLGDAAAAIERLNRCVLLQPTDAGAFNNLGLALAADRQLTAAIAAYDRALSLQPRYARALNNRGLAQLGRHCYQQALCDLDAALAIEPGYRAALINRGRAMKALGNEYEALACYRRAFPAPQALANASELLRDMNLVEESLRCSTLLYQTAPKMDYAAGIYHSASQSTASWSDYRERVDGIRGDVRHGGLPASPFAFLTVSDSPAEQLQCASRYATGLRGEAPLWRGEAYGHDRIRVAYLSSDFSSHATLFLAIGLFEAHDCQCFEIFAFSYGRPVATDVMRQRLIAGVEHFEDVDGLSARAVALRLRELEIDILVDLKGFTAQSRIDILAHRPAPLQVHYLGYPGTLGAEFVDYLIADRHVIAAEHRHCYAERIVYLPQCYQATDDRRAIPTRRAQRTDLDLPLSGVLLCAFHQTYKITPPIFDVWMRVLTRVPDAWLWLLSSDPSTVARLASAASDRGVDPSRLLLAPRLPQGEHLARLSAADLFLDTWPVGAHTTASDALWAGVPVLALQGESFVARVAASVLITAGLEELVTRSLGAYEQLLYHLCTEPERLRELRRRVESSARTSPLFDTRGFTRALEAAYAAMRTRCESGLAPEDIEL
jgi:protein O-GlcNAc transferase